jgi:hypothetical protein
MAIGRMGHCVQSFGEEVTTTGDAVQRYALGTLREEESSTSGRGCESYRYVYHNEATVATVAGGLAYGGGTLGAYWEVGMDISDVKPGFARGVFQSVLTNTYYGWIKTRGYEASLKKKIGTNRDWLAGDFLVAGSAASCDGMAEAWVSASTGESKVSGDEVHRALERIVGYAASTALSTTLVGKAYIDLE